MSAICCWFTANHAYVPRHSRVGIPASASTLRWWLSVGCTAILMYIYILSALPKQCLDRMRAARSELVKPMSTSERRARKEQQMHPDVLVGSQ